MNIATATVEEIKVLSAPMIGSTNGAAFRAVDYERFKAKFGVTPDVCRLVWNQIAQKMNGMAPQIQGFSLLGPEHILYALFFLRVYPTVRQAVGALGRSVGTRQFVKYANFMVRQIASLFDEVVSKSVFILAFLLYFMQTSC